MVPKCFAPCVPAYSSPRSLAGRDGRVLSRRRRADGQRCQARSWPSGRQSSNSGKLVVREIQLTSHFPSQLCAQHALYSLCSWPGSILLKSPAVAFGAFAVSRCTRGGSRPSVWCRRSTNSWRIQISPQKA